ncbi:MAG TPA: hypothetical protein VN620_12975 [Candidatus Methylomirabilis sp.]|nr:hypothetical protein [Candidatus Methylomirabilis sp.]
MTGVPLNVTVLVPCDVPKPLPTMATNVPTGPACGVISWITGAASAGLAVSMHATKRETARRILTALSWSDLRTPEVLNSSVTNALSDLFFMCFSLRKKESSTGMMGAQIDSDEFFANRLVGFQAGGKVWGL